MKPFNQLGLYPSANGSGFVRGAVIEGIYEAVCELQNQLHMKSLF